MKIARLLLVAAVLSVAAACASDVTGPTPQPSAATSTDTTSWHGGTGSGS